MEKSKGTGVQAEKQQFKCNACDFTASKKYKIIGHIGKSIF